jgi:hypothetical protein
MLFQIWELRIVSPMAMVEGFQDERVRGDRP